MAAVTARGASKLSTTACAAPVVLAPDAPSYVFASLSAVNVSSGTATYVVQWGASQFGGASDVPVVGYTVFRNGVAMTSAACDLSSCAVSLTATPLRTSTFTVAAVNSVSMWGAATSSNAVKYTASGSNERPPIVVSWTPSEATIGSFVLEWVTDNAVTAYGRETASQSTALVWACDDIAAPPVSYSSLRGQAAVLSGLDAGACYAVAMTTSGDIGFLSSLASSMQTYVPPPPPMNISASRAVVGNASLVQFDLPDSHGVELQSFTVVAVPLAGPDSGKCASTATLAFTFPIANASAGLSMQAQFAASPACGYSVSAYLQSGEGYVSDPAGPVPLPPAAPASPSGGDGLGVRLAIAAGFFFAPLVIGCLVGISVCVCRGQRGEAREAMRLQTQLLNAVCSSVGAVMAGWMAWLHKSVVWWTVVALLGVVALARTVLLMHRNRLKTGSTLSSTELCLGLVTVVVDVVWALPTLFIVVNWTGSDMLPLEVSTRCASPLALVLPTGLK